MQNFKTYTKEVAEHLDSQYIDLIENLFANDVAWDLSIGISPEKVYLSRSGRINNYYDGNPQKGKEIFKYVFDFMKKE